MGISNKQNKIQIFLNNINRRLHLNKIKNGIKKSWKKLKYLDKTQLSFYIVSSFIAAFCTFGATTYAVFTLSKSLNAAIITTAKLNYTLASTTDGYSNGQISIPADKKAHVVDLTLTSNNNATTKYALNYSPEDANLKVYYSQNLANNMMGNIVANGKITMRLIIVNNGSEAKDVNLTINGGYVKNELTTNITEGYYEKDIVDRVTLLDENFANATSSTTFPAKTSGYAYYKTECNEEANPIWDSNTWTLNLNSVTTQISCDTYFKKLSDDVEVYYELRDANGKFLERTEETPDTSYTFKSVTCGSGTATWDDTNRKLNISSISSKTLCVAFFNKNS